MNCVKPQHPLDDKIAELYKYIDKRVAEQENAMSQAVSEARLQAARHKLDGNGSDQVTSLGGLLEAILNGQTAWMPRIVDSPQRIYDLYHRYEVVAFLVANSDAECWVFKGSEDEVAVNMEAVDLVTAVELAEQILAQQNVATTLVN